MSSVYLTITPTKQSVSHGWMTTVDKNIEGTETRTSIFDWPRVGISTTIATGDTIKSSWIRSNLTLYPDSTWGIPIWPDRTVMTGTAASGTSTLAVEETDNRHFYDGRECLILNPTDFKIYEVCTIESFTSTQITVSGTVDYTWPTGSYVFPLYECRVNAKHVVSRKIQQYDAYTIKGVEVFESARDFTYTLPSSGAATYSGGGINNDLFLHAPKSPKKDEYTRPYSSMQFLGQGYTYTYYDDRDIETTLKHNVFAITREQIWDILDFFDSKKGQLSSFWVPTWNKDIVITEAIGAVDVQLTTEAIEYTTYMLPNTLINRHVYIQLPDKSYVCRKIVDATSTSVTINSAIGTAVSAGQLKRLNISFLNYSRFDIDEIEVKYERSASDTVADIDIYFGSLKEETDTYVPTEIYKFWIEGGEAWYYTSGDVPITWNGHDYVCATIERTTVERDTELKGTKTTINAPVVLGTVTDFLQLNPPSLLFIEIRRLMRDDSPYDPTVVFMGTVEKTNFKGNQGQIECIDWTARFMDQEIPKWRHQVRCNHTLYDDFCGVGKGSYDANATITVSNSTTYTSATFGAKDNNYYTNGYLEWNGEQRRITYHVGNTIKVSYRIPDITTGQTVTVYAGCDRSIASCINKFNNKNQFLGFLLIPVENAAMTT